MNFCLVHLRQFSVERTDCLTTLLFSQDLRCSTTTCKRCPSAFWRQCTLQEDPSWLQYTGTHNCAIVPKPSDHPERNLKSILLMRFHSISGQRPRGSVITWDIAWGFAKVRQEKGLRGKAADIIWSIRLSELPRCQQWMPPQCGEDSLCQKICQLICCSHVFWSKIEWSRFTLSNKPIQIDSVRSRDVLQVWASSFFDHLNHCRSVFEYVESSWVWTVGNVGWYVVNWLIKKCCQNVSETEWLFRACVAQSFPWLAYWIVFPRHIPQFEELVIHPHVNLRQTKKNQTLHCCEKLRFASCTSTKLEQTCVVQTRTVNFLTLIFNIARHLQMKHTGINQVCNLQSDSPHDRIVWSSLFH